MTTVGANRPIVVGVDSTQHGAIRYALDEAQKAGCGVRMVHAYATPATGTGVFRGSDLIEASEETAREILNGAREFVTSLNAHAIVEYAARVGSPTRALESESREARSIVLGPDDNAWFDRLLVGEVGSWLAGHSESPIIVVPENWVPQEAGRGGIVVAVDGSTDAHGPLTFAFEAADRRQEDLHVLHVVPAATTEKSEEKHRLNLAEVLAGWAEKYPSVQVFRSLVFGNVEDACIGATKLSNLVVVGRRHRRALPFPLTRPAAFSVIKAASCPVAIVPPHKRR